MDAQDHDEPDADQRGQAECFNPSRREASEGERPGGQGTQVDLLQRPRVHLLEGSGHRLQRHELDEGVEGEQGGGENGVHHTAAADEELDEHVQDDQDGQLGHQRAAMSPEDE